VTRRLGPLLPDRQRTGWMRLAACRGLDDLFFPPRGDVLGIRRAREVCAGCPVRTECLDYAIEHREQFGIWAGTTYRERRALWQQMRRAG
jgi:WhiB family redox-sensing transcriptional regulator